MNSWVFIIFGILYILNYSIIKKKIKYKNTKIKISEHGSILEYINIIIGTLEYFINNEISSMTNVRYLWRILVGLVIKSQESSFPLISATPSSMVTELYNVFL